MAKTEITPGLPNPPSPDDVAGKRATSPKRDQSNVVPATDSIVEIDLSGYVPKGQALISIKFSLNNPNAGKLLIPAAQGVEVKYDDLDQSVTVTGPAVLVRELLSDIHFDFNKGFFESFRINIAVKTGDGEYASYLPIYYNPETQHRVFEYHDHGDGAHGGSGSYWGKFDIFSRELGGSAIDNSPLETGEDFVQVVRTGDPDSPFIIASIEVPNPVIGTPQFVLGSDLTPTPPGPNPPGPNPPGPNPPGPNPPGPGPNPPPPSNNPPTDITLTLSAIDENAPNGTTVGALDAVDVDLIDSHTFVLIDDAGGRFAIMGTYIVVADGSLLDYESATSYDVIVQVTDSKGNTYDKTFTIALNDLAEQTPTDIGLSASVIDENTTTGATVGQLSTVDADAVDTHTYTLVDDAGGRFAIMGDFLVVADGSLLDYESATSHDVIVRVTDSAGLYYDKTFTITLNDVAEFAPTDVTITASDVNENVADGTTVGQLSAVDPDLGETHTYTIIDDAGGRFAIMGDFLVVADGSLLDYEAGTSYDVIVRATDNHGMSFDKTITITLNNLNDNTPFNVVPAAQAVDEDNALVFSTGNGNQITTGDADGSTLTVTLTATQGVISLSGITGLTFLSGDGTSDITMQFSGSQADIAAALNGLSFTPNVDANGAGSIQIVTTDGTFTDTDTIAVAINPIADTASVTNATTNEDVQTVSGLVISRNASDSTEVTHFQITNITGGTLYLNDGVTVVNNGDFITAAQGNAGLKFTPDANSFANGSFDVQSSQGNTVGGLGGAVTTATINVTAIADTPSVTTATTDEDTQTISGLEITRNAADGSEVTHFKITGITGGTLYQNDGVTVINNGDFITFAEANAGLKFTPSANSTSNGSFNVQASTSATNGGLGGSVVNTTVTVNAVADTASVTNATTNEDVQTSTGLVITRNAADGAEVTHFQITGITGGTLYQNDGTTVINNGDFISVAQGNAGLKFTPDANSFANGSFDVQSSQGNTVGGLGGAVTTATVSVTAIADTPSVTAATTNEDTQTISGLVITRNAADGSEVTHFKVTGITGGTLYQNDGTTVISNGDFITFAEANAGLKFTPSANSTSNGSFNVQASTSAANGGLGGSVVSTTVTVNAVADTASVTNASTNEDVQTSTGLVITRNAVDGAEVTHFQITGITGGTLYQNDGTTVINNGDFISVAQGNAGLKFTPDANSITSGSFGVQSSQGNTVGGLGGAVSTATVSVAPIADTPSVTAATTNEDTQTISGLVITRNVADGAEVTHFKVTGITGGTLYQNDGVTVISNGDFITFAQANAGLKFTPSANSTSNGSFDVQASTSAANGGLGGSVVSTTVTVIAVNDAPTLTGLTSSVTFAENTLNLFPQIINSATATIGDIDSADFNGGNINVVMTTPGTTDYFTVRHVGNGAGQIGVSGGTVSYGGVAFGTITGGGAGTALVVTFNASVSNAAIQALLQNILYQSTSDTPLASQDALITLNDGDGGTSTAAHVTVNITLESDANQTFGLSLGVDSLVGSSGDDSFSGVTAAVNAADTLYGGAGADAITFTTAAATVAADLANKYGIDGLAFTVSGNSVAISDAIIDNSDDGTSFDILNGAFTVTNLDVSAVSASNQVIINGTGAVTLSSGGGVVYSKDGVNTSIVGGISADTIIGGTGNDTLSGGAGDDSLSGGDGADVFITTTAEFIATDTIVGGSGIDNIRFSNAAAVVAANFTNKSGIDVLSFTVSGNTLVLNDAFIDTTDDGNNIELANGAFTITSLNTAAVLDAANHVIIGGTGAVTLAAVNNIVYGKDGVNVNITGGTGADTIYGGTGNDAIAGGAGNDVLVGGMGADTLNGGTGADAFIYNNITESAFATSDRLSNFSIVENDYIDLRGLGFTGIQAGAAAGSVLGYTNNGVDTTIVNAAGTFRLVLTGVFTALEANVITNALSLTPGADNIIGDASGSGIFTAASNLNVGDTITAGAGTDVLQLTTAATGVDAITVAKWANITGIDVLTFFASGNTVTIDDSMVDSTDDGATLILANGGNTITSLTVSGVANLANSVFIAGTGAVTLANVNSRIYSRDGVNTVITGGTANDTITGGTGNDSLSGGNGVNTIYGGAGNDTLVGGTGNSAMYGEAGNDSIVGGTGAESIYGGALADTLTGGTGADRFIYTAISDSATATSDRIADFSVGTNDLIDLTALGFTGIQAGAASGTILGYTNNGTDTIIVDAAGTFRLVLTGVIAPDANILFPGSTINLTASAADNLIGTTSSEVFTGTAAQLQTGDTITAGTGSDSLNLTTAATITSATLANITGVEIIRFNANGNQITLSNAFVDSTDNGNYIIIANGAFTVTSLDSSALTGGNYAIVGGTGAVTMTGTGGYVTVLDGVSATITGTTGADTITGGSGADTFTGGTGVDSISGGSGADRFNYAGAEFVAAETLAGGTGADLVVFSSAATIASGDMANKTGIETFTFGNFVNSITFAGGYTVDTGTTLTINGGTGNSLTANLTAIAVNSRVTGGSAADTILGGGGADTLAGGGGNDSIDGGTGADRVNMTVAQFTATTTVAGGAGSDVLAFTAGGTVTTAMFANKSGFETIITANASTVITVPNTYTFDTGTVLNINGNALTGSNTLYADMSALALGTTLTGGAGNDTLIGGTGADTLNAAAGNDSVDGGNGNDLIQTTMALFVSGDTIVGGAGTDSVTFTAAGTVAAGAWTNKSGVEVFNLFNGINSFAVGTGYTVDAAAFITINASGATGTNTQTITLNGASNDSSITGGAANDTITGGSGSDTILGGAGNDSITGGAGLDSLNGGSGTDTFSYTGATWVAAESLDGGANADAVIFTGAVSLNAASFANKTGVETFTTANATNSITLDGGYAIDSGTTITFDGSASTGSVQTFNVSASALNASLIGGSGNDVLIGGTGIDTLRGSSGADNMQLGAADGRADRVQYAAATDGGAAGANTGYDTITQFEVANDRFSFGGAFNGGAADLDDVLNNNAFTWATNAAANFNTTHEAMMITGLTDADLTQSGYANLLAAINGYGVTAGAGETGLFMVTGATHTAFYYYVESQASNTDVTAGEIRLLGDVSSLLTTANVEFY